MHGLFGSSDNWHPIAQRLAESFHVFAVDQRNHGLSPHNDEMNYALMAGDLNEFMTALGIAGPSRPRISPPSVSARRHCTPTFKTKRLKTPS